MATWGTVQRTIVLIACWAFYNLGACIVNVIITNEAFLEVGPAREATASGTSTHFNCYRLMQTLLAGSESLSLPR